MSTKAANAGSSVIELNTKPATELTATAIRHKSGKARTFDMSLADHEEFVQQIPEPLRQDTLWLGSFCVNRCNSSYAQLYKVITDLKFKVSDQYVLLVTTGTYWILNPSLGVQAHGTFRAMVAKLRDYDKTLSDVGQPKFVKTSIYDLIADHIQARRVVGTVRKWTAIIGATDLGKSRCFSHFAVENNHLSTIHVECPATRSLRDLLCAIGSKYNVDKSTTDYRSARYYEEKIDENVNETRTIILDNFQNLYDPKRVGNQPAMNWLRRLGDEKKCTIVASWTPWGDFAEAIRNPNNEYLRQFLRRFGGEDSFLHLQTRVLEEDVALIAESFEFAHLDRHLPRLVKVANQPWGNMTPLFEFLQNARRRATHDGSKLIQEKHLTWPKHIAA